MRHGTRPCPRTGRQDAVVQDEVDAWAGSQGGELLQELDRREEEVARAVVPLALQGDEDESVGRQCETLLRHRRAQHVAGQALDSRTVGTTEVRIADIAVGGTQSSYVSASGELRVRVRCKTTSGTFVANGNQLQISYQG